AGAAHAAALDRPPQLVEARQIPASNQGRLQWAPGGNADGTLRSDVVDYLVERNSQNITTKNARAVIHVCAPTATGVYAYRIGARTSDGAVTYSSPQTVTLAYPLYPIDEALEGKAYLRWGEDWTPWTPPNGGFVRVGYRVQRWTGTSWV